MQRYPTGLRVGQTESRFRMRLLLRDRTFAITRATLTGQIPDPHWHSKFDASGDAGLSWSIELETEGREFDGETWQPYVYHETLKYPIRRWTDFQGAVFEWSSPFDASTHSHNGGFYVFGHEDISRATLRLGERRGTTLAFEWSGICDVNWDDDYGSDVPFRAEGWVSLTGVIVRGSSRDQDEEFLRRLALHLEASDFVVPTIQRSTNSYDDGVTIAHATFEPRTA